MDHRAYLHSFFVIQTLQSRLDANGSRPIVAYFFFTFDSTRKLDIVKAMFLDIISQICEQVGTANVPESVRTLLSTPEDLRSRNDLIETIRDLSRDRDERTFLILDGLDQCNEESITEIAKIIPCLIKNRPKLSIMVSSRPSAPKVGLIAESCGTVLSLHDTNITTVLDEYISTNLQGFNLTADQKEFIQQQLRNEFNG